MFLIKSVLNDLKKAFSKGIFHLLFAMAFTQGSIFIIQFVVARILDPADFGYVKTIDAALGIIFIFAGFGMPSAVAKYVSEFQGETDKGKIFFQCVVAGVFVSILTTIVVFNSLPYIPLNERVIYYLRFLIWSIVFTTVSRSIMAYYQGRKQITKMAKLNIVLAVIMIPLVSIFTYCLLLSGWATGRFLSEAIFALGLLFIVRKRFVFGWNRDASKKILKFGAFAALSLGIAKIATTADVLYLAYFLIDGEQIGFYGVATLVAGALMLLPGAIGAASLPYISERSMKFEEALSLGRTIAQKIILVMLPVAILIFLFAPGIIVTMFGQKYIISAQLLRVLTPGIVVGSLLTIAGTFLLSIGRTDLTFLGNLIGLGFNITLNLILIPKFGPTGAAWAAVLTYTFRLVIFLLMIKYLSQHNSESIIQTKHDKE